MALTGILLEYRPAYGALDVGAVLLHRYHGFGVVSGVAGDSVTVIFHKYDWEALLEGAPGAPEAVTVHSSTPFIRTSSTWADLPSLDEMLGALEWLATSRPEHDRPDGWSKWKGWSGHLARSPYPWDAATLVARAVDASTKYDPPSVVSLDIGVSLGCWSAEVEPLLPYTVKVMVRDALTVLALETSAVLGTTPREGVARVLSFVDERVQRRTEAGFSRTTGTLAIRKGRRGLSVVPTETAVREPSEGDE